MTRFLLPVAVCFAACGNPNVPLDADSRKQVDSLAASGIGIARRELDSMCKIQHTTLLPVLVDSIKKERQEEIKRQLQGIPK